MFSEIRNRLTLQYAAVMAIFLLTFIIVSYSGVLWLLYREEQQDIRAFAEEEAREHIVTLRTKDLSPVEVKGSEHDDNSGGKIFFYVYDTNGQLVTFGEPVSKVRSPVQELIGKWTAADGEGKIRRLQLADGEKFVLIMCSMQIYDGPQVLGRVYVGEDITSYYEMLKTMLIVLAVVAVMFIVIATFIGHLLAGRAIIPVKQSYLRQREFAADASHELRTPLSILLTSVDAVQTDDSNRLTLFSTQVLGDMKNEIRRMSKIVSDLLTLARADAGVTNIVKEKFDLHAVTQQIVRSFQPVADEKGLKLDLDSAKNIDVFADRERINQLLLILVDNAVKYTPPGGRVDVLIRAVQGPKQGVRIIVQDTGVGIPKEHRSLIFERFYRIDKARSREEGGTGIGLSIARWIAEAHSGTIRVESVPGGGSSFIVTLPM